MGHYSPNVECPAEGTVGELGHSTEGMKGYYG